MRRNRILLKIGVGALVLLGAMQLVQFDRTNPPATADFDAAPELKTVVRRSCYDCHSNETRWPWYSRIAPSSWLMHYDVSEGRETLNFSEWGALPPERQAKLRQEIGEAVAEGDMPPWYYLPLHSSARLSPAERDLLKSWAASR